MLELEAHTYVSKMAFFLYAILREKCLKILMTPKIFEQYFICVSVIRRILAKNIITL